MPFMVKKEGLPMWLVRVERDRKLPPVFVWSELKSSGKTWAGRKEAEKAAEGVPGAVVVREAGKK